LNSEQEKAQRKQAAQLACQDLVTQAQKVFCLPFRLVLTKLLANNDDGACAQAANGQNALPSLLTSKTQDFQGQVLAERVYQTVFVTFGVRFLCLCALFE